MIDGSARLTADERIVVHGEIVDSLWEEDFTTVEEQQIVEDIRDRLRLLGLDPDQADKALSATFVRTSDLGDESRAAPETAYAAPSNPYQNCTWNRS